MKKVLFLLGIMGLTMLSINATEAVKNPSPVPAQNVEAVKMGRAAAFEKRIGLTEEQKIKAREIRIKGHENLRPVIEQIIYKKQEAQMVKMSRIAVQVQEERLAAIDEEIKTLEKKANEIRRANMKEFESILTRQQKKTLKTMKKEGRQKYHSEHPVVKHPMGQHPNSFEKKIQLQK